MKPFEDELHRALRRIDPPAGFADRVMARVQQEPTAQPGLAWLLALLRRWQQSWSWQRSALAFAATAAVAVLAISFVIWRQNRAREEQRQGELARAQVMQALHVTSVKLHRVRSKVRQATEDNDRAPDKRRTGQTKPEAMLDSGLPILD
jgi:negative regulator of sigma E activity